MYSPPPYATISQYVRAHDAAATPAMAEGRKLNLKPNFGSVSATFTFKRWNQARSSWGQAGVNRGTSWGQDGVKLGSTRGEGALPYHGEPHGARPVVVQQQYHRRAQDVAAQFQTTVNKVRMQFIIL